MNFHYNSLIMIKLSADFTLTRMVQIAPDSLHRYFRDISQFISAIQISKNRDSLLFPANQLPHIRQSLTRHLIKKLPSLEPRPASDPSIVDQAMWKSYDVWRCTLKGWSRESDPSDELLRFLPSIRVFENCLKNYLPSQKYWHSREGNRLTIVRE
jgi:hypothetical protein